MTMQSLIEYLKENKDAIMALLITFVTTYGASIIALVIGIVKTRMTANKQKELYNNSRIEEMAEIKKILAEVKKDIIDSNAKNNNARMNKLNAIAEAVNVSNNELKEVEVQPSTVQNALDSLDDEE